MKPLTEREIHDLLTPVDTPAPPAGLAEAIKREIPAQITLAPETDEVADTGEPRTIAMPRSRVWLMAASVVLAVGGGLIAYRFMDRVAAPVSDIDVAVVPAPAPQGAEIPAGEISKYPRVRADELEQARQPAAPDRDDIAAGPRERAAGKLRDAAEKNEGRLAETLRELPRAPGKTEPAPQPAEPQGVVFGIPEAVPDTEAVKPPAAAGADAPAAAPARREKRAEGGTPRGAAPRVEPAPMPAAPPVAFRDAQSGLGSNAGVEEGNARIAQLEAEARALESELKKLDVHHVEPQGPIVPAPSTGGTAEPNDAPYGDVFFSGPGTNPFIDTEDDALSTFGLDVDTGSYTVQRRYLRDGHLPPPESVRPEEYLNYFDYGDPAPEGSDEFAIHAEGAPSIYGEGERYYLLRFHLKGREIGSADRKPALLTFVVDVSGSMGRENRLGLVKQALALLLDQLRADDEVALVVYGSRGRVVLDPTGDLGSIRRAVDGLRTEGATNAEEGLTLAYDLAARHRRRGAINRVILCSDGVANVGNTSADSILERIRREADRGIELTTVGFGMGNYNDVLMERLADDGNGRYAYVDTLEEARRIFVENLTGTLQTLAAEARVQVEFDPETVSRYRLVGYENRDIADERFRDDTVDAGEIGAGHTVTALYEIKTHRKLKPRDEVATLHLRYGSIARREMVELSRTVTGADFARRFDDASPALQLTALVAEYAEILKHSYWAREGDLDDVFRRAQKLSGRFEGDREVADFVSLVGRAARLAERE